MGNTTNHPARMTIYCPTVNIKANITTVVGRFVEPAMVWLHAPRAMDHQQWLGPLPGIFVSRPTFLVLIPNFNHPYNKLPDTYGYQYR